MWLSLELALVAQALALNLTLTPAQAIPPDMDLDPALTLEPDLALDLVLALDPVLMMSRRLAMTLTLAAWAQAGTLALVLVLTSPLAL